jgi:hypothetical protein
MLDILALPAALVYYVKQASIELPAKAAKIVHQEVFPMQHVQDAKAGVTTAGKFQ